ncbi:hypothetical protein A3D85_01935 [Candidatus Amesbacteria bacterium RIFCSPHIGHO2_02_FULL_47_9]|uniref:Glycosyltransferase RgtA/B/C/D-like domain-containing protein n=1 Tax=Candidatus Amesbacteria bacterium RIFCSPHIGHO2_01_FULL_48_32b TaxID=1797253 RepID=A0A1F4YDU5_9BACT|nr:MAG: hypothetical protein A2876_02585 [Candidatus Amesbacteria bacterium RIFCSPHIGHO2_01_FULL_48_32b]OGD04527.1 MAG: hypothetical protein A3D85_01935 [Candidatus Amesbacteria bacterium RIFCSPHIGHO2_02_FULL_47_9]OGD08103.1 MAG: hypothetical protein A2899_02030 [Candidatus Amesbacteria bacterium RIFCSPLOWO2_01_FULL_49_25]
MKTKTIIKYYSIWQLAIIVIAILAPKLLPLRETYLGIGTKTFLQNPLLYSRANFDGNHYIRIAKNGYGYAEEAFFPLYPNIMKLLIPQIKNDTLTGVIISSVAFLFACIFFVRLIELDYSSAAARYSLLALLAFPTSFYFGAVYTESLFILLVLSSFYYARARRWWIAAVLGALAANTRFVGIFMFPALLLEFWQQRRSLIGLLPAFLVPLGLISYMLFLQNTVGDSLAFIHVQKLYGQFRSERIILLPQVFYRYTRMVVTVTKTDPIYYTLWLELVTALMFLFTTILSAFKKIRPSYIIFNLAAYLVPTFTGSFVSLPRYVLACFPSFIILGQIASAKPRFRLFFFAILALFFFEVVALFVRGYWVG